MERYSHILLIKLKVVELMTHVHHLQDTNSLASVSAMSLLCLSALPSSAWCTERGRKCVQYKVRAMDVEAWQNWVGLTVEIGNKEIMK